MSRFYQRYLSSMKQGDSAQPGAAAAQKPPHRVDPTALHPPVRSGRSSIVKGASALADPNGAAAPLRRVQIFNKSDNFNPDDAGSQLTVFAKSEASKAFLTSALRHHYLFENIDKADMDRIVDCMRPTFGTVGEVIIKQGDMGDLFFCLETGTAVATVDGNEVMCYEPGGCFGELALIYNSPRAASVTAVTACQLWALGLKTFRYILATTASSKMVKRLEFLKKCPFLDPLSNEQVSKLAGALDSCTFEKGQYIVRQGDVGETFYIIEEGQVKCTQLKGNGREVELLTLKSGDYFGEMSLMLNETRHANVFAVGGPVKCLCLSRSNFDLLLGDVQNVLAKRMRIRILQSVPLLSRLSEAKLSKLANVMRVQAFSDGAYIIRQGEEGSRFYIINEGEVKCTRAVSATEEEELIRLTAQEFFGERALITNEVRRANVIACGHVECMVLERSSFQTLLEEVQDTLTEAVHERDERDHKFDAAHPPQAPATVGPKTNYKFEDLRLMRTVGTGTFGRVKMVQHVPTGTVCALKCMNKHDVLESHQEKNILNEKNLLFECADCPFILQLLQTYNSPSQIFMLMEFVQGGELWSYIYEKTKVHTRNANGGFEPPVAKFYAANVILAFKHLASRGIAYRDLKPENLLIDSQGYCKVIDFGFAKKFPYVKNGSSLDKTYTLCGTPEYLAPEIVMSKGYDRAVDYWALGCLIYELYFARTPFQADYTTKIFQNIVASEKTLAFPSKNDPQHTAICKKLLSENPAFRLGNLSGGVNDIINDPFFSTVDWEAIARRQLKSPYQPNIGNALDSSHFDEYDEDDNIPEYHGPQEHFNLF